MDLPYFSQWPAQNDSGIIGDTLDNTSPNIPYLSSASASPVLPNVYSLSGELVQGSSSHSIIDHTIDYQMASTPIEGASEVTSPSSGPATDGHATSQTRTCSTSEKQRARNRQSQKAFRERKEAHIRDLEGRIVTLTKRSDELEASNTELKSECARLRSLVVLLMGGESEGKAGPSEDTQTKRAMRLKRLLELIDSVD
ncbi:hypothetical protein AOQ84DRAFT_388531 [Glonium stellatum]|uniref:BZIP domain-containing protein n=1 Tax=Glonium stellatum TaxID=574774 RepID=A0A8E2JTM5_9PEZI|nr:hypothetical protein AOQ84DRAFT_388531 [Glonium stellatum]